MDDRIRTTLLPIAAAAAIGLAGCAPRSEPPPDASASSITENEVAEARAVYDDSGCAACHGERGEGVEDMGPALEALASYWDVERLADYVRDPQAFRAEHPGHAERRARDPDLEMPAFDFLSEDDLRLLARWLLTL